MGCFHADDDVRCVGRAVEVDGRYVDNAGSVAGPTIITLGSGPGRGVARADADSGARALFKSVSAKLLAPVVGIRSRRAVMMAVSEKAVAVVRCGGAAAKGAR